MEINYYLFALIFLMSLLIIIFFLNIYRDTLYKITVLGIGLSVLTYSGLGISFEDINNNYLFSYFIYLICILFSFTFFYQKNENKDKITISFWWNEKKVNNIIINFSTILYFISRILYLIIPSNRLINLIIPPTINVYGVRFLSRTFSANNMLNIASLVSTLAFPFFLFFLYKLVKNKKRMTAFLFVGFWIYLDYAIYEYIGRYELIIGLLFLYLVLNYKEDKLIIKKKSIAIISSILVLSIPLLVAYEGYRLSGNIEINNLFYSIELLLQSEISYPKYYDIINSSTSTYGINNYLLWIFTLPIPKMIFPIEIMPFNTYFTDLINPYLDYTVLPSILGEGFMIFGDGLYWLHAIILGSIIGISYRVLSKYDFTTLVIAYISVLTFTIGRGGSMEIISFIINNLFVVWIILILKRLYKSYYRKTGDLN